MWGELPANDPAAVDVDDERTEHLSELAPLVSAQHGVFYAGEGLVGQCALEKERILLTDVPSDYVQISSGLGAASPLMMNIMMPVMNGYETMTAIRSRPQFNDLPIIAVTGKVMDSERERCIAAGASDYIPKRPPTRSSPPSWMPCSAPCRPTGRGRTSRAG